MLGYVRGRSSRYLQGTCLELLWKMTKNHNQEILCPVRDSNRVPQEKQIRSFTSGAVPRSISQEDSNCESSRVDSKLTGEELSGVFV